MNLSKFHDWNADENPREFVEGIPKIVDIREWLLWKREFDHLSIHRGFLRVVLSMEGWKGIGPLD